VEPNPYDPQSKEAADMMLKDSKEFKAFVQSTLKGMNYKGKEFPKFI